jgi:hypothetical protein
VNGRAIIKTFLFDWISSLFTGPVFIISGPKRGEVTGEWRKLHNEELHDL